MPRQFSPGDLVQGASATPGALSTVTASLDSPVAVEGHGGLLVMGAQTDIEPPEQWHAVAHSGLVIGGRLLSVMVRSDMKAGEQSWDFQAAGVGTPWWLWRIEEWANVSFGVYLGAAATDNSTPALTSISTGTTGTWDSAEYALGVAAVLMSGSALGAHTWPSASFSNGFTVEHVVDQGTGVQDQDLRLWVARNYGAAGETGPWETTATFTGNVTGTLAYAAIGVFRAEHFVGEA